MQKVIVVGGNAAGLSAASQIKRRKPSWEVTVYEKGPYISYGACGIPYHVEGLVPHLEDLITVTPEEAVTERKLDLKLNHEVRAIDPLNKTIEINSSGGAFTDHFDSLVIATGARPQKTGISYNLSNRVYTVHSLDHSEALRRFIEEEKPRRCAVIGGGYIAVEMIEALKTRGLETDMIHRREDLARSFEKEISEAAKAEMVQEGINLKLGLSVTDIAEEKGQVSVLTDDGPLIYDLVVVGAGVEPNSELARECGIETGVKGAIRVDSRMQTSHASIYAAGDCAETRSIITGKPIYTPLALKANKEGVVAGINISGGEEDFPGVLGTAITKLFNLGLARTGLTLAEAEQGGFDAVKFAVKANTKAHYYPGGGPLTAVLIAEKNSGRLLGAQLVGPVDGVKRIDVYATAITTAMTMNDIFQLDLAYAPPFSPVYDPVVLSGRVGRKTTGQN